MSVDPELAEVLRKCGCISVKKYFVGTTKDDLDRMPVKKAKEMLKAILPPDTENVAWIIKRIMDELIKVEEDEDVKPVLVKIEKVQVVGSQDSEDDDEIQVLKEVPGTGDVCFVQEFSRSNQPTICLTIDEDNDAVDQNDDNASTASTEILPPSPRPPSTDVDGIEGLTPNSTETGLEIGNSSQEPNRYITLNIVEKLKQRKGQLQTNVSLSASNQQQAGTKKRKLDDPDPEELFCRWPYWLSKLKPAGFDFQEIRELHIRAECKRTGKLRALNLSNLKVLVINHADRLNYQQELLGILSGSKGGLEEIRFTYNDEVPLLTFFNCLIECGTPILFNNLKSFRIEAGISNIQRKPLGKFVIELLSKVNAPKLEELFLGVSLLADASIALEKVLNKFTSLREFTIQGCFVTMSNTLQRNVVINFPQPMMPNLEVLDVGGSYKYASTYENDEDRPPKKMTKICVALEAQQDTQHPSNSFPNGSNDNTPKGFSVTFNLPTLPKLKRLALGCYFEIQHLHFSKMPQLEVFMVASPWHLSYKFPTLAKNKTSFHRLKEMQLPDSLKDPTFVQKVVYDFPNVSKWYINLPSVAVIRAFAYAINRENRYLDLLNIKVQFDFASSLDWIILDKPWATGTDKSPPPPTEDELNQIKVLKEYKYWEEYVQVNQIELPDYADPGLEYPVDCDVNPATSDEEEKRFNGLEILKQTRRLSCFEIRHLPRTLRLPKGELHFNDDQCEFTKTLIGYKSEGYPFSEKAWTSTNCICTGFDLSNVRHQSVPVDAKKIAKPYFTVDPMVAGPRKKKETN